MAAVAGISLSVGAATALIVSAPRISRVERPPPELATAPSTAIVTKQVIRERYTFSGQVSAATQPRPLPAQGVVTATPLAHGAQPQVGRPLIEINGRPVIGLDLPFPLWRDIAPGTVGKDVSVVQTALAAVGVYAGPSDGVYAERTQAAVHALYVALGYPPTRGEPDDTSAGDDAPADAASANGDETAQDRAAGAAEADRGIVLPAAEVAALGGGPWRIDLAGATVGAVLDGESGPSLVGPGTRLTVADEGRLAELLSDGSPRRLSLVVGDESTPARVWVVSSRGDGDASRVTVRTGSGRLPRGPAAGRVVVRTTSKPVTGVPVTALRPTANGRMLVRAVIDGDARDVPVRVGLRGERLVEVTGRDVVPGLAVELP
jgi:hypothetical protein